MATPKFDRDRALRIVLDATVHGSKTACAKWKISEKTLGRYRLRLQGSPELSEAVRTKTALAELEWGAQRREFLAEALAKMRDLIREAKVDNLRDLAEAVKIAGELQVTSDALAMDGADVRAGSDREGPASPQAPGGAGQKTPDLEPIQH